MEDNNYIRGGNRDTLQRATITLEGGNRDILQGGNNYIKGVTETHYRE